LICQNREFSYAERRADLYKLFARPDQRLDVLRLDSHEPQTIARISELLEGMPLDLLFIDGDHTYEGVCRDFQMYGPLVANGGMIAFHDIVPLREPQP
jgi:cephalosporin hydroxylase